MLKNKDHHWRPAVGLPAVQQYAAMRRLIRNHMQERAVLEVQTPLLRPYTVTDPYIDSIVAANGYLQTSPEYAMKELLCAHRQSIYQICKAFRYEEQGRWHRQEFTLLEWYEIDASMQMMLDSIESLIVKLFNDIKAIHRMSYRECFINFLNIDPWDCQTEDIIRVCNNRDVHAPYNASSSITQWLIFLFSVLIEPELKSYDAVFVYDYPEQQASLAMLADREYGTVAERFELYIKGVECGNGFVELTDAQQQLQRFKKNQRDRLQHKKNPIEIDMPFIEALKHGLPQCSGVAIGLDRLMMLLHNYQDIQAVTF